MALVRRYAFDLRGAPELQVSVPLPPRLLPIDDAAAITWQGSVGAESYIVERAAEEKGPWIVAGAGIDESFTQYRPLFADESASKGKWFYRVRAKSSSGVSTPSNVVGPVTVRHASLVDELADFSRALSTSGNLKLATHDTRKAKEDAHRVTGAASAALFYERPTEIEDVRVFAFFPAAIADLKFSISNDGRNYGPISASRDAVPQASDDYGYWKPVMFHAENLSGGRFLKIELTGETQIGRVEIESK